VAGLRYENTAVSDWAVAAMLLAKYRLQNCPPAKARNSFSIDPSGLDDLAQQTTSTYLNLYWN